MDTLTHPLLNVTYAYTYLCLPHPTQHTSSVTVSANVKRRVDSVAVEVFRMKMLVEYVVPRISLSFCVDRYQKNAEKWCFEFLRVAKISRCCQPDLKPRITIRC